MNDREVEYDSHVPSLIHFFGPDGSGKSAQARILVASLNRKSIRAKKVWLRAHHTLAFLLWKLFIRIGFHRVISNCLGVDSKLPAVDRSRLLRSFWSLIEFVSILPIVWRTYLIILRGYRVIAERYVLDTITAIAYTINDIRFLRSRVSRLLLRLIPKSTVFILLDADYETICRRRVFDQNNVRKSSVEPRVFIEFQRTAYKVLAKSFGALTIDTSKTSIEETSRIIQRYLGLI